MTTIPSELIPRIEQVLERASASVLAGESPFLPWVSLEEQNGHVSLAQVQAPHVEDAVESIEHFLGGPAAEVMHRWAYALDATVPFEGAPWEAIVVRAYDRADGALYVVAQRYRRGAAPELAGEPFRMQ